MMRKLIFVNEVLVLKLLLTCGSQCGALTQEKEDIECEIECYILIKLGMGLRSILNGDAISKEGGGIACIITIQNCTYVVLFVVFLHFEGLKWIIKSKT
jgi:hypothetical protein